jgi:hypothetical protein
MLESNGRTHAGFPTLLDTTEDPVDTGKVIPFPPVVGDDGVTYVPSRSGISAHDRFGAPVAGWPVDLGGDVPSSYCMYTHASDGTGVLGVVLDKRVVLIDPHGNVRRELSDTGTDSIGWFGWRATVDGLIGLDLRSSAQGSYLLIVYLPADSV